MSGEYNKMTKSELQKILKERGLKSSGNKPELIARLKVGGSKRKAPSRRRKTSRKPKKKKSRKPKSKKSRKPKSKKSRTPKRKASRKPKRKASRKPKRRKPMKSPRKIDFKTATKNEIKNYLTSLTVTQIKKSPRKFLKGSSGLKKSELITRFIELWQADKSSRAPTKSSRVQTKSSRVPTKSSRVPTKTSTKKDKWSISFVSKYDRNLLKRNPNKLYIFGENNLCYKKGEEWREKGGPSEDDKKPPCYQKRTQAIIRGEPNAAPVITTIKNKARIQLALNNKVKKILRNFIPKNITNILSSLKSGKFSEVVLSDNLIGTGISKLNEEQDIWHFTLKELARLKPNNKSMLDVSNMSIENFKLWLLNKPIRKPTKKQTRKPPTPTKKEQAVTKKQTVELDEPIVTTTTAEIDEAIRKCLFGGILPTEDVDGVDDGVDDGIDDGVDDGDREIIDDDGVDDGDREIIDDDAEIEFVDDDEEVGLM